MPADLVGGHYPTYSAQDALLGQARNVTQANLPAFTNFPWVGATDESDAAASLVGGKLTVISVPVDIGVPITDISAMVGVTGASTPTHAWAALYSGTLTTATLLGTQSPDKTTTAIAASTTWTSVISTYTIQPADAPYGYIYVGLSQTGTGVSSLIGGGMATAGQYAWFTDSPPFFAGTYSSALGATAPATVTLASVTAIATVPFIVLR